MIVFNYDSGADPGGRGGGGGGQGGGVEGVRTLPFWGTSSTSSREKKRCVRAREWSTF